MALLAALLVALPQDSPSDKLFKEAERLMDNLEFARAVQVLDLLARKYPDTDRGGQAKEMLAPGGVLRFKPLLTSGPAEERLDVVFVSEGYTTVSEGKGKQARDVNGDKITSEDDHKLFAQDVDLALKVLKAESPFREYWNFFNFYRLHVNSAQGGCDLPERGIERDTPLGAKLEKGALTIDWEKARELAKQHVEADCVLVLVNHAEKGASLLGRDVSVVGLRGPPDKPCGPEWGIQSLIHEMGHSIGRCGDEYVTESPFGRPPETEPSYPNITRETDRGKIKWKHWIEPSTPIPTPNGDRTGGPVGLFEGALSMKKGFYRPLGWCAMRGRAVGGENPYCPVCREAMVLEIVARGGWILPVAPKEDEVVLPKGPTSFEADVLIPSGSEVKIEFALEGGEKPRVVANVVPGAKVKGGRFRATHKLRREDLKPGEYVLTVRCRDLTPFVRSDPGERLKAEYSWKIRVE